MKGIKRVKKFSVRPTNTKELSKYKRDQQRAIRKRWKQEDPKGFKINKLFYYSKVRAKEKHLEHTLSKEWFYEQTKTNICPKTGVKFDYTPSTRNPFSPSVDRVDNSKGYTPENCQLVIWAYNSAKAHHTDEDLYIMCKSLLAPAA